MASLRHFPGSKYWYACFRLPNGKQRQVSTHTTDEGEAMQIAATYEKATKLARQRRWSNATARRILREIGQAVGYADTEGQHTVQEFLTERKAMFAHQLKGRSFEKYTYALDHFVESNPHLASVAVGDVLPSDAVAWRDALVKRGLAKATVNHQLSVLRQQWKEAVLKGAADSNPWEGVTLAGQNRSTQQRQAFTFAQFEALLVAMTAAATGQAEPLADAAEWRLLIKTAAYTGQRERDCATFDKANVDTERRVMRFRRGKNADWFEVPVHPALWPDIAAALKTGATGPLTPRLAARPRTGRTSLPDIFRQKILPRIGIVQPYATAAERGSKHSRRVTAYSFHSLRHSLSTWLNDAEVSDVDRARIVGHADREVSRGYTHTELKHARRAIGKVQATKH